MGGQRDGNVLIALTHRLLAILLKNNLFETLLHFVQLQKLKVEINEASNNPQALLLEAVHSAGYSGALGNSLMAQEATIGRLNSSLLEEFVAVSRG